MKNNVYTIEEIKEIKQKIINFSISDIENYKLKSPIDKNNQQLVVALEKYINSLKPDNFLVKLYNSEFDRNNFFYQNVPLEKIDNIEEKSIAPGIWDIAFLTNNENIIGHVIFKIKAKRVHFKKTWTTRVSLFWTQRNIPKIFEPFFLRLHMEYSDERLALIKENLEVQLEQRIKR